MLIRKALTISVCLHFLAGYSYADFNAKPTFGELSTLADKYDSDKGQIHHYTEVYEYFFYPIKYDAKKILEIGVWKGASLKMWRDYFPNAVIYGIDILDTSSLNSNTIKTFVADQADRNGLRHFINVYGGDFDVIIDDGGHSIQQQQVSFGFLFKYVKAGGYYIIEDVHTSIYTRYGSQYGATLRKKNTSLDMIDNFVRTGTIQSQYLDREENDFLTANIEYSNLLSRTNKYGQSIACIFKKRDKPDLTKILPLSFSSISSHIMAWVVNIAGNMTGILLIYAGIFISLWVYAFRRKNIKTFKYVLLFSATGFVVFDIVGEGFQFLARLYADSGFLTSWFTRFSIACFFIWSIFCPPAIAVGLIGLGKK